MAASAIRIGDQLILEEDYDESYIPQEQEILEYARMIGIDPDSEPELMWLAREGIVAPLPPEWKPCQDVTGDIYYFNFSTGQSSWDHPSDEHYRDLVTKEREKLQAQGGSKKKKKKEKKDKKKEKKVKDLPKPIMSLGSPLGPVQGPLGSLAPLKGMELTGSGGMRGSLSSSAGSSGGFDTLLIGSSKISAQQPPKPSAFIKSVGGKQPEQKLSLILPDLEEEDGDVLTSEDQSPRGSARLLKNLHMDIESLGGGFEYEESERGDESAASNCSDDGSEQELKKIGNSEEDDASRIENPGPCHGVMDQPRISETMLEHETSIDLNPPDTERSLSLSTESQSKKSNHDASGSANPSIYENTNSRVQSPLLYQGTQDESEDSEGMKDLASSKPKGEDTLDFGLKGRSMENILDITALSPHAESHKDIIEEEIDESLEEEISEDENEDLKQETNKQIHPEPEAVTKEIFADKTFKGTVGSTKITDPLPQPEREELDHKDQFHKNMDELLKPVFELPEHVDSHLKTKEEPPQLAEKSLKVQVTEIDLEEKQRQKLQELRELLRKQEEEEQHKMQEDQKSRLRSLSEVLEQEAMEAEVRMKEDHKKRLLKVEKELDTEMEAEERKIRERQQEMRDQRRLAMEHFEKSEEEMLLHEKNALKTKLKKEMDDAMNSERAMLLQEREAALQEIRERLKQEISEALESLKKDHVQNLERLRAEVQEKNQEEISNLQNSSLAHQQREDPNSLGELHLANKKITHILDYEREMRDLLQEKRQELQREHDRKLERMKEEHEQVVEKLRMELEEEEHTQRSKMLEKLREELGSMMQLHEKELETQRLNLEKLKEDRQRVHLEKQNILEEMEQNQEIRRKQLMVKTNQIDSQEKDLQKRREELDDQEKDFERKATDFQMKVKMEKEHAQLSNLLKQSQQELQEMQRHRSDMEDKVELIQNRYAELQKMSSHLEEEISRKQKCMKELNREEQRVEPELRLEDLTRSSSPEHPIPDPQNTDVSRLTLSPVHYQDDDPHLDTVRHYISSQGSSIQKAKDFLRLQTRSMCRRQTLLQAAKQQWRHDVRETQDPEKSKLLEGMKNNIDEEVRNLDEIQSTVVKGRILVQEKEHCLQELQSSLLEEISGEDITKGTKNKKAVTFDLSDSEDTCSISSSDAYKYDILPSQFGNSQRVQNLIDTLQRLTNDLNKVLTPTGPFACNPHSSPLMHTQSQVLAGMPLSSYITLNRISTPSGAPPPSRWAWDNRLHSSLPSTSTPATQSVDALLEEKWRKYFPGGSPSLIEKPQQTENKLGYVPAGAQVRMMQNSVFSVSSTDNRRMQAMIDTNKKWLENFRNDPRVPLLSRANRKPLGTGPLQLGLDENNQIKVFHY
ncbi:centrosomal protein of 164 kDa [Pelobates fuscus]|uniref:centrosomal protein of 164 kDa n=1 Tax=Pelobates fuscus TaxID=191477 RepID=UPI002FE4EB6C